MRFNKTTSALLLSGSYLVFTGLAFPALAKNAAYSGAESKAAADKNEGRKLSMTVPGLGTANITVTPAVLPKAASTGKPLAPGRNLYLPTPVVKGEAKKAVGIEANGNNITVRVPASVDAAIDDAQAIGHQLGQAAGKGMVGANHLINILVLYFRQWTGSTTITPGGYPYVDKSSFEPIPTTIASGHRLYYTGEGRLKSVVNR